MLNRKFEVSGGDSNLAGGFTPGRNLAPFQRGEVASSYHNSGLTVVLTATELAWADHFAGEISRRVGEGHYQPTCGESVEGSAARHLIGARSELAVAKALNLFWAGSLDTFKNADIGNTLQVRGTRYKDGCLLIREGDNPEHRYLLAIGDSARWWVAGWLPGYECRRDDWKRAPGGRPATWMVPQSALRAIRELRELLLREQWAALHRM